MVRMMCCTLLTILIVIVTVPGTVGVGGERGSEWVYLSSEVSIPRVGFGTCGLRNTAEMTCVALKNGVKMLDSAQARGTV
jgi:hypothetical protein